MSAPPAAWTAGTLSADLCQTLGARGWITVREIALDDRLTHRGDVVAMLVSGRINRVDIYELKVARSDLLGDLRREKWRAYLKHGATWFAFPAGLADPREIPIEAGVIVRRADGWRQVRAPGPFAGGPSVSLMRRLVMAVRSQPSPARLELRDPSLWAASYRARTENARLVLRVAADLQHWTKRGEERYQEVQDLERQLRDLQAKLRDLKHVERQGGPLLPLELAGR